MIVGFKIVNQVEENKGEVRRAHWVGTRPALNFVIYLN